LVWGNSFLVLDLGLHIVDSVGGLNVQGDGLACEGLHENLHSTSKSQDEVKGGFLLDIVVTKSSTILKLLASENESLLVGRDTLFILDLGLDIVNGVTGLDIQSDGLSGQSLYKDLHATS